MFITVTHGRKININKVDEVKVDVTAKTLTFILATGEQITSVYEDFDSLDEAYRLFDSESYQVAYAVDRAVNELNEIKDIMIGAAKYE